MLRLWRSWLETQGRRSGWKVEGIVEEGTGKYVCGGSSCLLKKAIISINF